jgi:iron(III) transport system ATP-binding protein
VVGKGSQRIPWKELPKGDAVNWSAGFRPSDVHIDHGGEGLRGVVKRASFLGPLVDYLVEIDGAHLRTNLETHVAIADKRMFKEGDACTVSFRNLHWFDAASLPEAKNA